jgi:hypothetical protein
MKRRTLDIIVSIGGAGLAVLLVILGLVMANRANFAKDYVRTQLTQQDLAFPTADKLAPRERQFTEARSACVIRYAGQAITTGKQAECYANEYLGGHLTWLATRLEMPQVAFVDGLSYRRLGVVQADLNAQITAAKASNDPSLTALQQRLADVTTVRDKMFQGTMLRNALLTSYGFASLGVTAGQVGTVAFVAASVLVLLAAAGCVHAFFTSETKTFGAPHGAGDWAGSQPAHA